MQGMMTLIRVLPSERYDEIVRLREERRKNGGAGDARDERFEREALDVAM